MATAKKNETSGKSAKTRLIDKVLGMNAGYSENDCKSMKTNELKELLVELENEKNQPEPTVDKETGTLVVPEPIKPPVSLPTRGKVGGGQSKRDVLYAVFDAAHKDGGDLKAAAKAALPDTSDGVVSSYLCYWRKDRGVVASRGFGNTGSKKSNGQKVHDLLVKLYGENYDLAAVCDEVTTCR